MAQVNVHDWLSKLHTWRRSVRFATRLLSLGAVG